MDVLAFISHYNIHRSTAGARQTQAHHSDIRKNPALFLSVLWAYLEAPDVAEKINLSLRVEKQTEI